MAIHVRHISLIIINVLLLIAGLAMMFGGTLLIYNYHMTRLYFLSKWLYAFPVSTITIGLFLLLVSVFGIIVAISNQKLLLIMYSVVIFAMVFPIFFNQYAAMQLKQDTDEKAFTNNHYVVKKRSKFFVDIYLCFEYFQKKFKDHILTSLNKSDIMEEWYYIQSDLKCCGDGRHGDTNGINCKYSGETSNHQQKESNIRSYSILFCRESDSAITNICLFVSSSDSLKFLSIHPSFHFQVCLNCSRFFILKHNFSVQRYLH